MRQVLSQRQAFSPSFAEVGQILQQFWSNLLYRFSREGRLIARFNELKGVGRHSTPAVLIRGEQGAFEVIATPNFQGCSWAVYGGRTVRTEDIIALDAARVLAGYD